MKKLLLLAIFCFFFAHSNYAQDHWGIGLRAGDPTGITAKKYMGKNALEISFGRTYYWYSGGDWYNRRIDYWYDKQNYDYRNFDPYNYRSSVPLALQVHYLFHRDVKEIDNLQWYWGVGGQARMQRFYVDYNYRHHNSDIWLRGSDSFTNIDLGVDGVLGLEYNFDEVPISVFTDVTLFLEFIDRPFMFWGQFGLGARYNFK